jgi:hypothetical protein
LASWHFHNYVSVQLQSFVDVPTEAVAAFHLGCFAPDLVERSTDKRITHFTLDIGTLPFYPLCLFKFHRWSSPYSALSVRHRWFYRGYAVHLLMDLCWMRECAYPFFARRLFAGIASQATYAAYYADMLAYDKYHRYFTGQDSYKVSLDLLHGLDLVDLLPATLSAAKVQTLIVLLERTRGSTTTTYNAKYISWHRVLRFLDRSLLISQQYLKQAMAHDTLA